MLDNVSNFWNTFWKTVGQNGFQDYVYFSLSLILGCLAVWAFRKYLLRMIKRIVKKTHTKIDDLFVELFDDPSFLFFYFAVFYLSARFLNVDPFLRQSLDVLGLVVFTLFGIRIVVAVVNFALSSYWLNKVKDKEKLRALKGVITVIKVVTWGLGIVLLLDNLGIKISAVIAGLGIGGIAVALGAQAILGDLFSYFAIFLDRPFEIGDFIIVGDYMGAVEHIGVKTTRIRSLGGEQIVFSNTDLTNSRVRNYRRMEKRRVSFKFGVTYQTGSDKLKGIPEMVKDIISNIKDTVFDRTHFYSYGDFSLVYEVVYYIFGSDYNKYMDIQQDINLAMKDEFEKRGIEFAYPTQTLYVNKAA